MQTALVPAWHSPVLRLYERHQVEGRTGKCRRCGGDWYAASASTQEPAGCAVRRLLAVMGIVLADTEDDGVTR